MTRRWRRCIECGKRRARPTMERCRQCHAAVLLNALDRIEITRVEGSFHRWQHGYYGLTAETCPLCQNAKAALERIVARQ